MGRLRGKSWAQGSWTNRLKIDLGSPFGPLSSAASLQAVGVLLGSASAQGLPINFKPNSWATIGNFSQYLFVKGDSEATAQEFRSGHPLRGVGEFRRSGNATKETNPITRDAS